MLVRAYEAALPGVRAKPQGWNLDNGPLANALSWLLWAGWEILGASKFKTETGADVNLCVGSPALGAQMLTDSIAAKLRKAEIDKARTILKAHAWNLWLQLRRRTL